jgi:hypothetical protein
MKLAVVANEHEVEIRTTSSKDAVDVGLGGCRRSKSCCDYRAAKEGTVSITSFC